MRALRVTGGQEMTHGRSLERYHKRLNQPPFAIGKLPVRRLRGDTRKIPEQEHEEDARRAAETAERQENSDTTSHKHNNTNTWALPNLRDSGANQVSPAEGHHKNKADETRKPSRG